MSLPIASILSLSLLLGGDPPVEWANSTERVVRLECRAVNVSESAQDIEIRLPLPRENERQEVRYLLPGPGFEEILEDRHGNRVARYVVRDVEPGGCRARGWIAAVRVHAAVYGQVPEGRGLSPEERALYTRDATNYRISSPEVLGVRDACIRQGASDEEKAASIFRWLVHNVTYERDGRWAPAPEVLRARKGSCSEYTYALMALLRSAGIPCRSTGGLVLTSENGARYDVGIHEDRVFHRWTEIWIEARGWIPADASRGAGAVRRFDNYRNFWGRLPAGLLQTWRGDGGDDGLIGWQYVAEARSRGAVKSLPVAFWIEAPLDRLEGAVHEVNEALASGMPGETLEALSRERLRREVLFLLAGDSDPRAWPSLARALLEARHPAAIRFSVLAARAGLKIPEDLGLALLAGPALSERIRAALAPDVRGWYAFEDLWRKTRAAVLFDETSGRFVLREP